MELVLITVTIFSALTISSALVVTDCPPNETYVSCGSACPPTCQDREPKICTLQCIEGCFCQKDYVREGPGGGCVPRACENVPICRENEKFTTCATSCERTCNATEPNRACPLVCRTGCICAEGHVREREGGECIPEVSCKRECGENEVYQECGTLCPGTCTQPSKACERKCAKGCFCKDGYILDDETKTCVKHEECAKYFQ